MIDFNSKLQDRLNIVTSISLCKPGIERELIQTNTHTHTCRNKRELSKYMSCLKYTEVHDELLEMLFLIS